MSQARQPQRHKDLRQERFSIHVAMPPDQREREQMANEQESRGAQSCQVPSHSFSGDPALEEVERGFCRRAPRRSMHLEPRKRAHIEEVGPGPLGDPVLDADELLGVLRGSDSLSISCQNSTGCSSIIWARMRFHA